MYLLDWGSALQGGAAVAGGKGWNLARLHRYGFPAPRGGVISAQAYRDFMANPAVAGLVAAASTAIAADVTSPEALAALARIRDAMTGAAALPDGVTAELVAFLAATGLQDRPIAVRSSATAEDSGTASFAGIHLSILHVTGTAAVARAITACYASLWTPQAVAYRRRLGFTDEAVAAAIVLLEMVPARTAGAAFACDPRSGRLDRYAISASLGLGETVVGGDVSPDEYLLDITHYPPAPVAKRIGRKEKMAVPKDDGGTQLVTVADELATQPALTDPQLAELAFLVGRVSDALGESVQPQDVEWAHDGERFWLLQSRPVTNLPVATLPALRGVIPVWSNANLKDVIPGVQSTLGWSFIRSGMDVLLTAPMLASGYQLPSGLAWVRLFEGRAYFNLSLMHWTLYDALGVAPAETNRLLGGHQPESPVPPPTRGQVLRRALTRLRLSVKALLAMQSAPRHMRRIWDWTNATDTAAPTLSTADLLAKSLQVKQTMDAFFPVFQLINSVAGGTLQELFKLLEPAFGDRAVSLANSMLAGASEATSAQQGERLVRLGNEATHEEQARAYFADPDWQPADWAVRLAGTRFKADFDAYLRDYGHRGVYEVEAMNPRWKEDPTYLLEIVRAQVLSGRQILTVDQREKRARAKAKVFGRLGRGLRAGQAKLYLTQIGRASALRETSKSILVKTIGTIRILSLETGRRLVAEGLLETAVDVFHLCWLDLEAYMAGRPGAAGFKALVADRKALRAEHLRRHPPDVIIGEKGVQTAASPLAHGPVLTGMGVASGRTTGRVRIIHHPSEGSRLQPGEILVAPSTDPAWTPLFLRASAVVMEVGGYLSHGAIVAREYSLPAVVNVPRLLQALQDGETITVDGDQGKIYLAR